tara:strand:+ start:267 stop:761 length:495 start_codon:yes stop_codon:yes gene_type:complete
MAINNQTLNAGLGTEGSGAPTVHEIFTKINNAKDKPQKIAVLKQFDNQAMRQLLKAAFDPKIKFDLPEGNPPYIKNEAPAGTEHTSLASEARKLYHFVVGGNNQITKLKKETMFIQMLEGLHGDDAEVLMAIKNKTLNNAYKGLTANLVKETFNWNDDFVRIAQ